MLMKRTDDRAYDDLDSVDPPRYRYADMWALLFEQHPIKVAVTFLVASFAWTALDAIIGAMLHSPH